MSIRLNQHITSTGLRLRSGCQASMQCILLVSAVIISSSVLGQTCQLSGTFTDQNRAPLVGVPVTLMALPDTTQTHHVLTDTNGVFLFKELSPKSYQLKATYLGFRGFSTIVVVKQSVEELGPLILQDQINTLQTITVVGKTPGVEQKGDTMRFNANAYKVTRDASTEDLVRKLPGMTLENGVLKAQGQTVQQVLVDGKPFFGDDPAIALRNLPAELIDKIDVFDRLSDQARFSGINDGNTTKTINIVTHVDRRESTFGRFYAGAGTAGTYTGGGNINWFNGDRRVSVIGLANDINQQNFSTQDLVGVTSNGPPKPPAPPGSAGAFQVGQQSGINRTRSVGINFSDSWGKHVTVQGSYFFNNSANQNVQTDYRQYFLPGSDDQFYRARTGSESRGDNHRLDARIEYTIDSRNSLVLTPRFSSQVNWSGSELSARTMRTDSALLNQLTSQYASRRQGYTFSNNLLLRHRFAKPGRTLSADLGMTLFDQTANRTQQSQTDSVADPSSAQSSQQRSLLANPTHQLALNMIYTEPLTTVSQLHLSYNRGYQYGKSALDTHLRTPGSSQYSTPDWLLSNTSQSDYWSNRAMVGYHLHTRTMGFVADLAYQWATQLVEEIFPGQTLVRNSFINWLPAVHLDYNPSGDHQLRIEYRTATQIPSVSQLQNVIDNTNPLLIRTGNPALKQGYSTTMNAQYTLTRLRQSRSLVIVLGGNRMQNYIGNSTQISDGTIRLRNDSLLDRGVQLVQPVNLAGYYSLNSLLTYSQLLSFIKTNLSLQVGYSYSRVPSQINGLTNDQHGSTLTQGITLSSNISQSIDFYASYSLNYSQLSNTIQTVSNNRYRFQTVAARLVWLSASGFMVQTDLTSQAYRSFSGQLNQHYTLWNLAAGHKFLPHQQGELKLAVFDLLGQNSSISQNLTDTYFQLSQSRVLQRYFMLTFTYTLRQGQSK